MSVRFQIAVLVFMMVHAVLFGVGTVIVLATPLADFAMALLPVVIAVAVIVGAPLAWIIAPRLRARFWGAGPSRDSKLSRTT